MRWRQPMAITEEEQETLERLVRRPKTAQGLAQRSRIVLGCADTQRTGREQTDRAIARDLAVTTTTVHKWRTQFPTDRLEGLSDEPRRGAPRKITDGQVEAVATNTLETTPQNAMHRSTREIARATGMSQTAVSKSGESSA